MTHALFDLYDEAGLVWRGCRPSSLETANAAAPSAVFHTFRSELALCRRFLQPLQIRANEHETPGRPRPAHQIQCGSSAKVDLGQRPRHLRMIMLPSSLPPLGVLINIFLTPTRQRLSSCRPIIFPCGASSHANPSIDSKFSVFR